MPLLEMTSRSAEPIFLDETNEDDHTYQGRPFWPSAFRDEVLARLFAPMPNAAPKNSAWASHPG